GCMLEREVLNLRGPSFLAFYVFFTGAMFLLAKWARFSFLKPLPSEQGEETPQDLTPYEIAYLAGGGHRVIEAALASLVRKGAVQISDSDRRLIPLPAESKMPLEPFE